MMKSNLSNEAKSFVMNTLYEQIDWNALYTSNNNLQKEFMDTRKATKLLKHFIPAFDTSIIPPPLKTAVKKELKLFLISSRYQIQPTLNVFDKVRYKHNKRNISDRNIDNRTLAPIVLEKNWTIDPDVDVTGIDTPNPYNITCTFNDNRNPYFIKHDPEYQYEYIDKNRFYCLLEKKPSQFTETEKAILNDLTFIRTKFKESTHTKNETLSNEAKALNNKFKETYPLFDRNTFPLLENGIVGILTGKVNTEDASIKLEELWSFPYSRNQHIGDYLMRHIIDHADTKCVDLYGMAQSFELKNISHNSETQIKNTHNLVNFYTQYGFKPDGRLLYEEGVVSQPILRKKTCSS